MTSFPVLENHLVPLDTDKALGSYTYLGIAHRQEEM